MKELKEKIGTKKLLITLGIIILIIILFMVGALMYNKMFYKKSYTEVENIMVNASKKYYGKNEERLPKSEGETTTIDVSELVKQNYMKEIKQYLKNDKENCSGKVNVTNINNKYKYTPKLECNNYKPKYLIEYIKENEQIVKTGDGLYEMNNELVFRGENINNYVEFANNTWRIVKITNNKIMLILDDVIKDIPSLEWDDRFNEERDKQIGINKYEVSRIKDKLTSLYEGSTLFTDSEKLLIVNNTLEIGKRKETDEDKTGTTEKSQTMKNQYIGLLPIYDYLNASIDVNCKSIETKSCNNYNYLYSDDGFWWFLTADSSNTYDVYKFDGIEISKNKASSKARLKPVIYLTEDTFRVKGKGTKAEPYTIK